MTRRAVVLMNLGGPDRPESVEPFLMNLFNDPAIVRLPQPLRFVVARLIAKLRAPKARDIYDKIGGGSPILALTEAQAKALEGALGEDETRVFVAMRYWQPMSFETALMVKDFAPDQILLLPLYPQYSTTTSASSLREWHRAAAAANLRVPTQAICCYPTLPGFISAQARLIEEAWTRVPPGMRTRLLFSAHGLPRKIVRAGDPYPLQVAWTAEAIVRELGRNDLDWAICYQSRVGPLEWIGPPVERELARAGQDGAAVVVTPIAFVSEHSETLVELDMDYARVAAELKVPAYVRVPTVGTTASFIDGLADLVRGARDGAAVASQTGDRLCPTDCGGCALSARPRRASMFDPDPITAGS
jgi:ferrochelatase